MRIRKAGVVFWDTGFGTTRDVELVSGILRDAGYSVRPVRTRSRGDLSERRRKFLCQFHRLLFPFEVQVHLEQIHREQFRFGRRNILIPNPDFTDPGVLHRIPRLTAVACKTRAAEGQFAALGAPAKYVGFTSSDRWKPDVEKDYGAFVHMAGRSPLKGTDTLVRIWSAHPDWPVLTVVRSLKDAYGNPRGRMAVDAANIRMIEEHLPEAEMLDMQNRFGVHICPSVTEGFGHYIMEALSTKALVLATDGEPMNELVSPPRGILVAAEADGRHFMNTRYRISERGLGEAVEKVLAMPMEERRMTGERARAYFTEATAAFFGRMRALIEG
ncbi:MAG: hypothetical protein JJU00_02065 [Opitutales bacterium]|nr:hypothetical protein [Opitutales bacterium]